MAPFRNEPTKRVWKRFLLKYFDLNDDDKISWWEVCVPLIFFLILEIIANIIANFITS